MHQKWKRSMTALGAAISLLAAVSACSSDNIAAPPSAVPTETQPDTALATEPMFGSKVPGSRAFALELTEANRNVCEERSSERGLDGKTKAWSSKRKTVAFSASNPMAPLVRYRLVALGKSSKEQTAEVDCVLPQDAGARAFMNTWFKTGPGKQAVTSEFSISVAAEFEGTVYCTYDGSYGNQFWCGTITCDGMMNNELAQLQTDRFPMVAVEYEGGYSGMGPWTCSNGCTLIETDNGMKYDCPYADWDESNGGGDNNGGGSSSDWPNGNGAVNLPSAPALSESAEAWSMWAHNYLIEKAFGPIACAAVLDIFKSSSLIEDLTSATGTSAADVVRHGMRTATQTPQEARELIDSWIDERKELARAEAESGNWKRAMEVLGQAIHTITDRYSPAHVDAFGNPRIYPTPAGENDDHSLTNWTGRERTRDAIPLMESIIPVMRGALSFVRDNINPTSPSCASSQWYTGP
jgi:hypothetical protein